jgi:2-aminoethylphosphonate-pyruvate transaminase
VAGTVSNKGCIMIKTAVIMAAGIGTRFGDKTKLKPKGFIEFMGKSMIIRSIEMLLDCGITRIIIGTGYLSEFFDNLIKTYPQIECCNSPFYASTNSLWTLCNCKDAIGNDDFILLESDIVYEKRALNFLLSSEVSNIILGSNETKFQDQYFLECSDDEIFSNYACDKNKLSRVCGELIGIYKISSKFYQALCAYYEHRKQKNPQEAYINGLLHLSKNGYPLYILKLDNLKWYEIDEQKDLEYAEKLFGG